MANVLSEEKKQQVVGLGRLGWPLRRIEEATGIRRETASRYLKAAGISIRSPGGWGRRPAPKAAKEALTDSGSAAGAKPAKEVPTDSGPGSEARPATVVSTDSVSGEVVGSGPAPWPPEPTRSPRASRSEPYREIIERGLSIGRNAMAVWQDLVSDQGFAASYASVQRYVRKLAGEKTPEARGIILTEPGEEAQVDYGEGPMVRDSGSGKYRRCRLFVLTLGFSRKSVRLLVFRSSTKVWAELHERAFRRLGSVPKVIVLDNLREGVLKPDIYDPILNPLYRDCLAHYDVVALPCRVRHPDRKGKVESSIGHTQRTPLKGLRFESLEEAQTYLDRWEAHWADTRIHGTTKRQVAAMFAEEKPFLRPLPIEPFRFYQYGNRTVHLDGHVEVQSAYYSVPPGHIGRLVWVQWDDFQVRILDPKTGMLLREHLRHRPGNYRTEDEDRPPRMPRGTQALLFRAERAGKHIGTLAKEIYSREKEYGVRRILGVLSLARKYGAAAVDDACAAALDLAVPTYRFVRRYLERHLPVQLSLRRIDPLIRELTHYRNVINNLTQEDEE
jgi:transposase